MPTLRVNDINLYYEVTGQGQPLLLVHGLGSSTRDWVLQTAELSRQFQVITFDLRGHGQTDKPPAPYSMAQFAADTAGLLRGLGVGPAHVVGLSLGGMVAFQLAVDAPALIKTLTIVNSGPALIPRTLAEKFAVYSRLVIIRLLGMRKMSEMIAKRLFPRPEQAELCATAVEHFSQNDQRAYLATLRAMIGWSVLNKLGAIECPTLVIASDHDYTPVAAKEAYVKRMPHARLVVMEDARHAVPIEHPQKFNAVVAEFLAQYS